MSELKALTPREKRVSAMLDERLGWKGRASESNLIPGMRSHFYHKRAGGGVVCWFMVIEYSNGEIGAHAEGESTATSARGTFSPGDSDLYIAHTTATKLAKAERNQS